MLFTTNETEPAAPTERSDADRVAAAVAALGPLDHEALLLRIRGRTIDEIATETGTTTAMVRVRLHRAATAVERQVGPLPSDGSVVRRDATMATEEVVADAEVGITPVLRARLTAAVDRSREVERLRHRRRARLVQGIVDHAHQLASLAAVTGFAVMAAVALASAA